MGWDRMTLTARGWAELARTRMSEELAGKSIRDEIT